MVIGIFGESCTGKTTLAERIAASLSCEIFTGMGLSAPCPKGEYRQGYVPKEDKHRSKR